VTALVLLISSVALTVPQSQGLAAKTWGMPPCGTPAVVVEPAPLLEAAAGWVMQGTDGAFDCVIHLTREAIDLDIACEVVVHEWGHLAGRGHVATGVMRAEIDYWPPCHRTVRVRLRPDRPTSSKAKDRKSHPGRTAVARRSATGA